MYVLMTDARWGKGQREAEKKEKNLGTVYKHEVDDLP